MTVQSKFREGLALHQQGQLVQARQIYQQVLKVQPQHADALHFLGMLARQTGNPAQAVQWIRKSLEIFPDNPAACSNLGNALSDLKRYPEAINSYDKAIALQPSHAEAYSNRGVALNALKQHQAATASYDKAIALKPDFAQAWCNRGVALHESKRHQEAIASYDKAIALHPNDAEAWFHRGNALNELKQHQQAIDSYERTLGFQPDHVDAWCNRGIALHGAKQYQLALDSYNRAINLKPDHAEAYSNRGNALLELNQQEAALDSYGQAIALQPDYAQAYSNRGIALNQLKRYQDAIASFDQAIAIQPSFSQAWCSRANALHELKQDQQAIDSYDQALAAQPTNAEAWYRRGVALHSGKQYQAAIGSFDQVIGLRPDHADALFSRGNTLVELKLHEQAIVNFEQALALRPEHAEAYSNYGIALNELKQHQAAIDSFDRAIALKPDLASAYNNRGCALACLKQHQLAVDSYDKAIALESDQAGAWCNRGVALLELKQHQAAIDSYGQAMALQPDMPFVQGPRLHIKKLICDWHGAEDETAELLARIDQNAKVSTSFSVLALTDSPRLQRKAAEIWANDRFPPNLELGPIPKHSRREKIRLGYFSMDFNNHPVSHLTAELFETHDRDKFEVYAFSFGVNTKDEMRTRLEAGFDRFIDVWNKSERDIAELARHMAIDIAIDLAGFTGDSRTGIFARRAAPLQVNYLGYPGTMGASYMDYLIADRQLIPEDARPHYAEQIVYLPDTYMVNDTTHQISERSFTREELGLPAEGFVFCCFNASYKIAPSTFDGWMRILNQVTGSVLWLSVDNPVAVERLRKEAEQRGVAADRLVFARKLPLLAEHLARHSAADLFIDTLPYNAHTTASDALWAGLPVLTCLGESFASRVAASLLNAIGLPELIASSQQEYETLAVQLALNPERMQAIRQKLARHRLSTALFDTPRFTRHLEDAYTQMLERYHADLPPAHICVAPRLDCGSGPQ
jgi:predicted O-linked N-acetylglucosamine transferase (SPINDLY family)